MFSLDSEPHVDQLRAKSLEKHTRIAAANKRHGTRIRVLHSVLIKLETISSKLWFLQQSKQQNIHFVIITDL